MFASWLATSPLASALRTALALGVVTGLNYVTEHVADFGLPVIVQLVVAASIPPIVRALNPADGVFGTGATVTEEVA